jgi:putative polyketide hydroxylase
MKTEIEKQTHHVPVLIVGGGITGLSAALFLQQHGVKFLLVERHPGTSILPRARTMDIRSMELFRSLGLSAELREAGKDLAPAWGVINGPNLIKALDASKKENADRITYPSQLAGMEKLAAQSPEDGCRCTQDISEVVLKKTAEERGGDLRFYHELITYSQDDLGIIATIQDRETGVKQELTADYLIAADGARSPIRTKLAVETEGMGALGDFINVYFEADLEDMVRGREFSQFLIDEEDVTGFMLTVNNKNKWAFHLRYYPEKGQKAAEFSNEEYQSILQRVIGMPVPIKIISSSPWQMTVRVAKQFKHGRVFLAGDAAHTMPPYAGKGANSGIQDAHNLAWKLALVLKGKVPPVLLETYSTERQPVTAFYANLSGQLAGSNSLIDFEKLKKNSTTLLGLPDYIYHSAAIGNEKFSNENRAPMHGQSGSRLPHIWMDQNKQKSTLDMIGNDYILITNGNEKHWRDAVTDLERNLEIDLPVNSFPEEKISKWQIITYTSPGDALLIRPDGFVALQLKASESIDKINRELLQVLGF